VSTDTRNSIDVALGDVNGDFDVDAVFAGHGGRNSVCLGDGSGGFVCGDVSTDDLGSFGVGLGDMNGDNKLDAVFANLDQRNRVCLGNGSGGFTCSDVSADTNNSWDVAVGDVDRDGGLDVIFANFNDPVGQRNRVCLGDGSGGFSCSDVSTDASVSHGLALAPGKSHPVGLVDPSQGVWYLRNSVGVVTPFFYGNPGDIPFMGDWDCDGVATPGLFRQSDAFAYLRNTNSQGIADIRFFFGNPSDIPLAGDFNGDGCDTLSIYRPSEARFYIVNALGTNDGGLGPADYSFLFGNLGDKPVVGDWDGDGIDEIGLHRETTGLFYWRNTLDTGIADGTIFFGDPGDRFVAGDWGIVDGRDTPAVFRPSNTTFYFRHTLTEGNADSQLVFGQPGWLPVAGQFGLD
jgi:hypothetical protein